MNTYKLFNFSDTKEKILNQLSLRLKLNQTVKFKHYILVNYFKIIFSYATRYTLLILLTQPGTHFDHMSHPGQTQKWRCPQQLLLLHP